MTGVNLGKEVKRKDLERVLLQAAENVNLKGVINYQYKENYNLTHLDIKDQEYELTKIKLIEKKHLFGNFIKHNKSIMDIMYSGVFDHVSYMILNPSTFVSEGQVQKYLDEVSNLLKDYKLDK